MRLWAGEKAARVWVGDTMFRVERGAVRVEESVSRAPGALDASLDEVVAWSPSGRRLDDALVTGGRAVLDAIALDEVRIAAVLAGDGDAPRLVVGPPEGPFEAEFALDAHFDGKGPGRAVRVHASDHGIAITVRSGLVAVIRPGASAVSFTLRVATQPEAVLDAVPTREGVLVTELVAGRYGTVLHLAPDGAPLGRWQGFACVPALLLDVDRVLAYDDERHVVVLLSLPRLDEVALANVESTSMMLEAALRPQGGSVVVASSSEVLTVTVKRTSLVVRGPYPLERGPIPVLAAKPAKRQTLREVSGPPAVGFSTDKRPEPPWQAFEGDDAALAVRVRSVGGAGKGLVVVLGGAAIDDGLIAGVSMRVHGLEAPLAREGAVLRGVLPDVELPQGLERAQPTMTLTKDEQEALEPTHLTVEVVVRGLAKGSGLLSVSVSSLEGLGIKRARPITVA